MRIGLMISSYPELHYMETDAAPLGPGYLVSYARRHLDNVEFVFEVSAEAMIAHKPDLVGLSFVTYSAHHAARQAREIKEALGCPVVAGGVHVSALPQQLDPAFDLAVLGEGEETFVELLRLLEATGRLDPAELAKIDGLAYHDPSGEVVLTPRRPLLAELDSIPPPDRELTRAHWKQAETEVAALTSRGCPFDCAFCSAVVHWGRRCRFHSDDYVFAEIEAIRNTLDPRVLTFEDDLFVSKRSRVLRLLEGIRERGLHKDLELRCSVRANLMDEEIMESLARTGFRTLHVGFESGSDAVLEKLNKQGVTRERNERMIDMARRHGIEFSSCLIFGTPGETRADISATFDFVEKNADALRWLRSAPLIPFPGTAVWRRALEAGQIDDSLRGVMFREGDVADPDRYFRELWPYLNEAEIPRAEMRTYLELADRMGEMIWKLSVERHEKRRLERDNRYLGSIEHVVNDVPAAQILLKKAMRRLR